ncbi:MAG: T9SS type A sorting domain-containing protein [Bacteroidota bacterium]|nr:T9SS type A sorting domain-containing protein [Bacteroidota bacterium]MDP4247597.1 T9SS type A sorting domain-containing protein [Bacteroidota bacterium]MDP4255731.1 T9SS type A sorting domain-containing protein [Bacteroidota bacterium]MDP4257467.1 T9SS type A sorting domain-containing protein [Bacteroidota bacterium]
MRTILASVLALFYFTVANAQVEKTINVPYTSSSSPTYQALLYLPSDYNSSSKSYPLLVFCHGTGEAADGGTAGTGLAKIYNSSGSGGPAYFIEHGGWPSSFKNPVTGAQEQFIVVSPQAADWDMAGDQLANVVNYLVKTYRVDVNRIHLTGLSAGGMSVVEYVSQLDPAEDPPAGGSSDKRTYPAATVVPMSQASNDPIQSWGNIAVANGTKCWGFGDPINDVHGDATMDYVSVINNAKSGYARFTTFNTGHGPWGPFYNPAYTENFTWNGVTASYSIYSWMLANTLGGSTTAPPPPPAPVANAGSALTITLPANQVTLSGSGSTGTITSYSWTKSSGPSAGTITSPSSVTTTVTGLVQGTYVFKLTLNGGSTSTVQVTVNAAVVTPPATPVANAGSPQTITLPTNQVTLSGAASTGTITSYKWIKKSGPSAGTITSSSSVTTTVTGLVQGVYLFQLTLNGSVSATVQVTVNAAPVVVPPPVTQPSTAGSRFIDVNVYGGDNPYNNTQWNNWNVNDLVTSNTLNYTDGTSSGIAATLSINESIVDNSSSYGGAMAPAEVLRYSSYCEINRTLTLSGLKSGAKYTIELYASRNSNTGSSTVFTAGGQSASVATYDNLANKATLSGLAPDGQGQIAITISTPNSYNYLNGFVITETSGTSSASVATIPAAASATAISGLDSTGLRTPSCTIYPNPVRDHFLIELNNAYTGTVMVTITDQAGATKRNLLVNKDQQMSAVTVATGDLSAGVYFITIQMGSVKETRKILKL